jgi:hypothetical protein
MVTDMPFPYLTDNQPEEIATSQSLLAITVSWSDPNVALLLGTTKRSLPRDDIYPCEIATSQSLLAMTFLFFPRDDSFF